MATIKGKYRFFEEPTYYNLTQAVNFTSNGAEYVSIYLTNSGIPHMQYKKTSGYSIACEDGYWYDEAYKIVDFGETEQTVSDSFNTYVLSHMEKVETIPAGTYVANDVPQVPDNESGFGADISFTSNGQSYSRMWIDGALGIEPYLYYGTTIVCNVWMSGWSNEAYKTITIETDQIVSDEDFATWFNANYTLQTEETQTETVEITYNGKTITLTAGQKCTFKGGKVMQGDIVAVVSASEEEATVTIDNTGSIEGHFGIIFNGETTEYELPTGVTEITVPIGATINFYNYGAYIWFMTSISGDIESNTINGDCTIEGYFDLDPNGGYE